MRLVFMGTPAAAVPTLRRLLADNHEIAHVWTQPDKPAGRGNKIQASAVKEFALSHNLPVYQPSKIKTPDALELFASAAADAAIVVAYGRILPASYLNAFRYGCINNHFSLLPKYRGAAPVNWALVQGETETGVTTMRINEGLDTGDILLQRTVAIDENETAPELLARLAETGADAISETLSNIDAITPRAQDETAATFAPLLKREDGLITWELAARDIVNRIRGFQPFPTAFAYFADKKLTLWRASAEELNAPLEAGTILKARGDELLIACGENSILRLEEVQPEGARRMPVRDFLNGAKVEVGQKLM